MLITKGNVTFYRYGSEPPNGYNESALKRIDFITDKGVLLIGTLRASGAIDYYDFEKEYPVIVEFHDVDAEILEEYPELASEYTSYQLRLGRFILGKYSCTNVELIK